MGKIRSVFDSAILYQTYDSDRRVFLTTMKVRASGADKLADFQRGAEASGLVVVEKHQASRFSGHTMTLTLAGSMYRTAEFLDASLYSACTILTENFTLPTASMASARALLESGAKPSSQASMKQLSPLQRARVLLPQTITALQLGLRDRIAHRPHEPLFAPLRGPIENWAPSVVFEDQTTRSKLCELVNAQLAPLSVRIDGYDWVLSWPTNGVSESPRGPGFPKEFATIETLIEMHAARSAPAHAAFDKALAQLRGKYQDALRTQTDEGRVEPDGWSFYLDAKLELSEEEQSMLAARRGELATAMANELNGTIFGRAVRVVSETPPTTTTDPIRLVVDSRHHTQHQKELSEYDDWLL